MARRLWLGDQLPAPERATRAAPAAALEYIVIDEIEDGVAQLIIEPWPELDERGRLAFTGSDRRTSAAVAVARLEAHVREHGVALERPLRTGDVLGAAVDRAALAAGPQDPAAWMEGRVVDAVHQARAAAKAQYFAAVGPVLTGEEVDSIAEEFYEPAEDA